VPREQQVHLRRLAGPVCVTFFAVRGNGSDLSLWTGENSQAGWKKLKFPKSPIRKRGEMQEERRWEISEIPEEWFGKIPRLVFSVHERWSLTMAYSSFEELEVWKRSCRLAVTLYQTLETCKDFGLRDQMQRAAVSIASNIAEGCERGGKDFARFLRIAQGSAAELRTQVYIARKILVVAEEPYLTIIDELKQISKMLTGLRQSLKTEN
jgi:four helix bundle protein